VTAARLTGLTTADESGYIGALAKKLSSCQWRRKQVKDGGAQFSLVKGQKKIFVREEGEERGDTPTNFFTPALKLWGHFTLR